MDRIRAKRQSVAAIKARIRKRLSGDAQRPRLSVYRSEKHIYGQLIDDVSGRTLASASTMSEAVAAKAKDLAPLEAAKLVGAAIAEAAKAKGITAVAFDRNGRRYAGRLQALAEAARAGGLQF